MNSGMRLPTLDFDGIDGSAPATYFAPAGRESSCTLKRQAATLAQVPLLTELVDAMPSMVLVLNGKRQIVAANRTFLDTFDTTPNGVIEKRPGEAIGCLWSEEGPDGCGTGLHCSTCGAVRAIMETLLGETEAVRECRVYAGTGGQIVPLDLRVRVTAFDVVSERFLLVVIENVSDEKRLMVLQRTFFHDVLNTAGCIRGYAEYLGDYAAADRDVCQRMAGLTDQLIEEIQAQRDLLQAESGDFKVQVTPVKAVQLLEELRGQYLKHEVANGREIVVKTTFDGTLLTDRRLLTRVLGNMLKNALEATPKGGAVSIACSKSDGTISFLVTNPDVMPLEVQLQVFQRSFSTKGDAGRGIGTYSMKLFGERYLGGQVDFVSRYPEGTRFRLSVPECLTVNR